MFKIVSERLFDIICHTSTDQHTCIFIKQGQTFVGLGYQQFFVSRKRLASFPSLDLCLSQIYQAFFMKTTHYYGTAEAHAHKCKRCGGLQSTYTGYLQLPL